MEGQAKIVWNFLEAAYRTGALDNFMDLSKAATDKKYENQATVFAELEDAITEMDDFSSVDQTLEKALSQMPALSDPAILEGLGALVSLLTPVIDSTMKSVDRDTEALKEKRDKLLADLPRMARALFALLALNSGSIAGALGEKSAKAFGENLGKGLNAAAAFVNDLNERDPSAIPDFMAGAFNAVDGDQVAKMADTLTQAFLDRRPPVLRWTASTVAKRAGKIIFRK